MLEVPMRLALGASIAVAMLSTQQTFKTQTDLVNFGVVVTDKQGAPITGLTADDFEIKEEGKPQTIKFFASGDPENAPPLHSASCSTRAAAWKMTSRTYARRR